MKKKFLFLKKEDELDKKTELYSIFLEEFSKAERMEMNYFTEKGKFKLESYICKSMDIDEMIEEINSLKYEKSLSFYYVDEQKLPKLRVIDENNIEEVFNDLISIFDKRKINQCFNYEIEDFKKEEIVEKCIEKVFNKTLIEREKKILKEIMLESINIDKALYENIEGSKMKLKKINKKIKELEKIESLKKNGILKNFEKKYSLLNFSLELNKRKKIELRDVDFSKIETIFPKRNRYFSEKIFKNKIGTGKLKFEELILDESYNKFFSLEFVYFNDYLNKIYGSKIKKRNTNYDFSKYLVKEGGLLERYNKKQEHYLKFDYTKIGLKIWKGIEKRIDDILVEEMILINEETELEYKNELMEIFEKIYINPGNKEKVIDFREKVLEKYYGKILDKFEEECKNEIEDKVGRKGQEIYNFGTILPKRILNKIKNKKIGLAKFFPISIEKYFERDYKNIEDLVEKKILDLREEINENIGTNISEEELLKKLRKNDEKINETLKVILNILNRNVLINNKLDILEELNTAFKELRTVILKNIDVNIIDIQKILRIIYDPIPILQETIYIYLEYEELKKIRQIVGVELKNKFGNK